MPKSHTKTHKIYIIIVKLNNIQTSQCNILCYNILMSIP